MPSRINLNGDRDPDARLKDRTEAEWAALLAGVLSDQYDELLEQLDPNNPNPPSPTWWDKWGTTLMAALGVSLLNLSQVATESAVNYYGVGVDWDAVLQASQDWATRYGYDLVRGINATSQAGLQKLLSSYQSGTIDYDTLVQMLSNQYGPTRAASIAATEVSRGFEQGIDIYQDQLEKLGMQTDRVWLTAVGACPLCEPMHGRLESEGWPEGPPPRHPNCYCYTEVVVLPGTKHYQMFKRAHERSYTA